MVFIYQLFKHRMGLKVLVDDLIEKADDCFVELLKNN